MNHPWFKDFDWNKLFKREIKPVYQPFASGCHWEENFDPQFILKRPTDNFCFFDPVLAEELKEEFKFFDFNNNIDQDLEMDLEEKIQEKDIIQYQN